MADLAAWRESPYRKPLVLLGARQVGKTYILQEFGARYYTNVVYVNCEQNSRVASIFADDLEPREIVRNIGALTFQSISPGGTLLILDEVQEAPRALTALKYFCESAPEYHVVVAGSRLGISTLRGISFPVGKVDFIHMYPMTYREFALAKGASKLVDFLDARDWETVRGLSDTYEAFLREYYFVGGMPEAVKIYLETNDTVRVRGVHERILETYRNDMAKHTSGVEQRRIGQVWDSIPAQLAKENQKFIYGVVRPGARAREYELALQWLRDAGLILQVNRVSRVEYPLKFYEDVQAFKLYVLDCGLLAAMANISPSELLLGKGIGSAKGYLTENYVCCELVAWGKSEAFYYSAGDSRQEVDFVLQGHRRVIPLEVKAERNLRSKSLKALVDAHPGLKGLRVSMEGYAEQGWMENIPLYGIQPYFEHEWEQEVGEQRAIMRGKMGNEPK